MLLQNVHDFKNKKPQILNGQAFNSFYFAVSQTIILFQNPRNSTVKFWICSVKIGLFYRMMFTTESTVVCTVQFVYLETCSMRRWGKTKDREGSE